MKDPRDELGAIRELLRDGKVQEARQRIRKLLRRRLDPEIRRELAAQARLAGAPAFALALMRKIRAPSPEQTHELALALMDLGAHREAAATLRSLGASATPQASVALAVCCYRLFDWVTPLPGLERLVAEGRGSGRVPLVARFFLATGLIHGPGELARARALLDEVLASVSGDPRGADHLGAIQLMAQALAFDAKTELALALLRENEPFWSGSELLAARLCRQWHAITSHLMAPNPRWLETIRELRDGFEREHHAAFARHASFYLASLIGDRTELLRLYYGSPFPQFRAKVARVLDPEPVEPWMDRSIGPAGEGPVIDSAVFPKPGSRLQRLFQALAEDFHEPPALLDLHALVFPGEPYDPKHSPDRMHQLLRRLRSSLRPHGVEIQEQAGRYFLRAGTPCAVRVHLEPEKASRLPLCLMEWIVKVESSLGPGEFSAEEATAALKLPYRSVIRHLGEAVTHGAVLRSRNGREIRYRIAPQATAQSRATLRKI